MLDINTNNHEIGNNNLNQNCLSILSHRQLDVLIKLGKGMTEYAISKELGLSIDTIRFHKKNIFNKLNATCSAEAVVKGLKGNHISLNDL